HPDFYQMTIWQNFYLKLGLEVTTIIAILLLAIFSSIFQKKNKLNFLIIQILLILGIAAYHLGLLLLYWFSFSGAEAMGTASMERYIDIYLIAWLFLNSSIFMYLLYQQEWIVKIRKNLFFKIIQVILSIILIAVLIIISHTHFYKLQN